MRIVKLQRLCRNLIALGSGMLMALLWISYNQKTLRNVFRSPQKVDLTSINILDKANISENGINKFRTFQNLSLTGVTVDILSSVNHIQEVNADYVMSLRRNTSILCYINTHKQNHYTRAIHVHNTWAKRCTKHIFLGTKTDPLIPLIDLKLQTEESREHLWSKIRKALRFIYDNYLNDYDYFLKADDDTYVYLDNLRYVLQSYSPAEPFMMGHRFRNSVRNGFFSGGAGYILSKEALKRIVEHAIDKHPYCPVFDENKEDVKMSICAQAVGVRLYDTRDHNGRNRFRWRSPEVLFNVYGKMRWLPPPLRDDFPFAWPHQSLISDSVISFHYVNPSMMYIFDFFQYHIRPIGITNDFITPN